MLEILHEEANKCTYDYIRCVCRTHNFLLYPLILYTLRMVAEGNRNMYVWSISNVHNQMCICWFLHKACLNARYGKHNMLEIMQHIL